MTQLRSHVLLAMEVLRMSDQTIRRIPLADERRQRIWALFNAGRMSEDRATIRLLRLDLEVVRAKRAIAKR
jgi:hypothetical protein